MNNDNFFHTIVSLTSDIIWEADENWCYTSILGKFKEYIGYTADEVIGRTPFSLMSEIDSKKFSKMFHEISSKREFLTDIELKLVNQKNKISYLNINGIPFFDEENNFKGYRGIARNITDKKLAEAALKESEKHLSTLIKNLPGVAYRSIIDNSFKLEFASDGIYDLTGYTPSDIAEKRLSFQSLIHPDDFPMVKNIVRKSLNDRKQFEVLHRIITAGAKVKWVLAKGFGIYKNNKLIEIKGFSTDVTETKNAVEYGKKSERRFKDLFDSNPLGIAIGNTQGIAVQTNKTWKKMFGYSDDDMHKIHMSDFRIDNDKETDFLIFKSLLRGINELYRIERQFIKKDGSLFWCDITVALIENPEGSEPHAIGLYADITERKKIEEELKRFREELKIMVSERTEEINMLTRKVINSQEEERQRIARDLHDGVGQTILAAKYAINSFTKGNNKDRNLLERSKLLIDMASQELREVYTGIYPSMLNELGLNDTINWFVRNFLETSGIKVNYTNTLAADISYDLSLNIYRIIQELFNNIVKHSCAGSVDVSLAQGEQLIVIELSDNGTGFDIEETKKTSTGAGLINVRQRVEYLKGHVGMESMPGRTFIKIEIPLEQQ